MALKEITKPASKDEKDELIKAVKQRGWKLLESREVVNRDDVRGLTSHAGSLVSKGKKLCVSIIERE